jgi:hypothetical protein
MTPDEIIGYYVGRLRTAGAHNVGEYEARLRQNASSVPSLNNFLSEAIAALMLLDAAVVRAGGFGWDWRGC